MKNSWLLVKSIFVNYSIWTLSESRKPRKNVLDCFFINIKVPTIYITTIEEVESSNNFVQKNSMFQNIKLM